MRRRTLLALTLACTVPALRAQPPSRGTPATELDAMLQKHALGARVTKRTLEFHELAALARTVLYVLAGFLFIGLGVAGWFGRWNWRWMVAGLGGCAIIALSGYIVGALFVEPPAT